MSLFQKSVINKYLKTLNAEIIHSSFERFKKFYSDKERIENIRLLKEENYQEGFLRELFVEVLGYTINPDKEYNLTTEFKNQTDAKKADGAILENGKAIGVIELKSTKTTSLESITDQAFNYKNHQPDCRYIITSNFEKIRFYIDNATDFEEFNLFTLTEDGFKILYLIFSKESIFNEIPIKLKNESVLHEENISKQLYQDYSQFKHRIFENLIKNNPQYDKLTLFKKSQKLLDRILFILFGEDSGLVPPNAISKIVDQWKALADLDEQVPLYSRFIKFFHHLDVGHKYKTFEVPAYNGGLFRKDELLETVLIDDEVLLADTLKLSAYDFKTEIDVNILGHIFENSLNELEELTAELEGKSVDKNKTKRKKEGVYYTPKYITKYIVENTVGALCNQKKKELKIENIDFALLQNSRTKQGKLNRKSKELLKNLKDYSEYLLSLKILDPACGSGAFLNQALEFLLGEHQFVDEYRRQLEKDILGLYDVKKSILENNLYGVDINEEAVEIAKLSLWLRTAERGRQLSNLSKNIKCGNSLIDDLEVAGDKAFKWEKEFPQIFDVKENKLWHITFATHDSRTSQRMKDYKVRERRFGGTKPKAEPVWMETEDEIKVTESILEIIKEDNLKIPAYNICGDHVHLLLACEKEELSAIVGKIKAISAREYNIWKGKTIPDAFTTRGYIPLSEKRENTIFPKGQIQAHLWTQKFGKNEITDTDQLHNTLEYIKNNREKHELPKSKKLKSLIDKMICSKEKAFEDEYKGGFDVVIGNPPYMRQEIVQNKNYLVKKYKSGMGTADLYVYFYELGLNVLKEKGYLSFITPNKWFKTKYGINLRELVKNLNILNIIDFFEMRIFESASTEPQIIVIRKSISFKSFNYSPIKKIAEFASNNFHYIKIDKSNLINEEWIFVNPMEKNIINKILTSSISLNEYTKNGIKLGIKTALNKAFIVSKIIRNQIVSNDPTSEVLFEKYANATDIKPWHLENEGEYYFINTGYDIEISEISYKGIWQHLKSYKSELENRQDKGKTKYNLRACDYYEFFYRPKIIYIHTAVKHYFYYDTKNTFVNNNSYIITNSDEYLAAFLNSLIFQLYKNLTFVAFGDAKKGGRVRLNHEKMARVPIPILSKIEKKEIKETVKILKQKSQKLNKMNFTFIKFVQNKFEYRNLEKKLQNWSNWNFVKFEKIIQSKKKRLSLSEQAEWMTFFEDSKDKICKLKNEIKTFENNIDHIFYQHYGLSTEEIQIVENSTKTKS